MLYPRFLLDAIRFSILRFSDANSQFVKDLEIKEENTVLRKDGKSPLPTIIINWNSSEVDLSRRLVDIIGEYFKQDPIFQQNITLSDDQQSYASKDNARRLKLQPSFKLQSPFAIKIVLEKLLDFIRFNVDEIELINGSCCVKYFFAKQDILGKVCSKFIFYFLKANCASDCVSEKEDKDYFLLTINLTLLAVDFNFSKFINDQDAVSECTKKYKDCYENFIKIILEIAKALLIIDDEHLKRFPKNPLVNIIGFLCKHMVFFAKDGPVSSNQTAKSEIKASSIIDFETEILRVVPDVIMKQMHKETKGGVSSAAKAELNIGWDRSFILARFMKDYLEDFFMKATGKKCYSRIDTTQIMGLNIDVDNNALIERIADRDFWNRTVNSYRERCEVFIQFILAIINIVTEKNCFFELPVHPLVHFNIDEMFFMTIYNDVTQRCESSSVPVIVGDKNSAAITCESEEKKMKQGLAAEPYPTEKSEDEKPKEDSAAEAAEPAATQSSKEGKTYENSYADIIRAAKLSVDFVAQPSVLGKSRPVVVSDDSNKPKLPEVFFDAEKLCWVPGELRRVKYHLDSGQKNSMVLALGLRTALLPLGYSPERQLPLAETDVARKP